MDQKLDFVFYTGGSRWGVSLLTTAAKHLTPMVLELGGKNPVFVDKSCDIDKTAKRLVSTRMFNSGQVCVCPDYVMCDKVIIEQLLERMKYYVKLLY